MFMIIYNSYLRCMVFFLLFIQRYIQWEFIDLFQIMVNENNKEEFGAVYFQEMYEVSGNFDEVCNS